ncbi:MAG: hypothetical protein R6U41_02030 [Desulfosalsimonas sp.]|uniref:hypothetical protein n=1 Tax=Desulfosalsimonas sp. TaxID=3073848 RepID=UPI0039709060
MRNHTHLEGVRQIFDPENKANVDELVKSLILDGAVKSSRSRLAQFRRMQRT